MILFPSSPIKIIIIFFYFYSCSSFFIPAPFLFLLLFYSCSFFIPATFLFLLLLFYSCSSFFIPVRPFLFLLLFFPFLNNASRKRSLFVLVPLAHSFFKKIIYLFIYILCAERSEAFSGLRRAKRDIQWVITSSEARHSVVPPSAMNMREVK